MLQKIIKGKNEVPYPISSVFDQRKLLFKKEQTPSLLRSIVDHQSALFVVAVADSLINFCLSYYGEYLPKYISFIRFIPLLTMIYTFCFWITPKENLSRYFTVLKSKRDSLFEKIKENFSTELTEVKEVLEKLQDLHELKKLKVDFDKIKEEYQNIKELVTINESLTCNPLALARQYYKTNSSFLDLRSLETQLIEFWQNKYKIFMLRAKQGIEICKLFDDLRTLKSDLMNKLNGLNQNMVLTSLFSQKLDKDYSSLFDYDYDNKKILVQIYGINETDDLESLSLQLNPIWLAAYQNLLLGLDNPRNEIALISLLFEKLESLNETFNNRLQPFAKLSKIKVLSGSAEQLYEDWKNFLESRIDGTQMSNFNQKYGINVGSFDLESLKEELAEVLDKKYKNLLGELEKEIKIQESGKKGIARIKITSI